MAWKLPAVISGIVEGTTKATKSFFEQFATQEGEQVEEDVKAEREAREAEGATVLAVANAANARAIIATPVGGTAGVTGYIGPLISTAISKEGLEESAFLEDVEQYFDGCTPEVALKPETTVAGTTRPKVNISNFLGIWKKIGPKKRWRGHTLMWWQGLAQWMYLPAEEINGKKGTWSGTEAQYRKEVLTYIKEVVEQVGQRVDCWDVLNELTNGGKLRQCAFTEICGKSLTITKTNPVMQFYAECIRVAKEANPAAMMFVNEYEIETTFNYGSGQRGAVFLEFINVLIELEASNPALYNAPDGIGMQFHTNTKRLVTAAEIESIVPKYTEKELVVEITEFDCQIEPGDTEAEQGEVYEAAIEGAKKAGVGRFTIWGVTDKRSWLNATWEVAYAVTAETAIGSTVVNVTGASEKKLGNGVAVRFKKLPAGVTTLNTTTTYFVVGAAANSVEVSATEGGAAIKVEGAALKPANTEIFKWAGKGFGPRGAPFSWEGEVKPAWRSIERSRPETPGTTVWKALSLATGIQAKAGKAPPQARGVGLNTQLRGAVEATSTVTAGSTIFTVPAGLRPPEFPAEIDGAITGPTAVLLTVATNGAATLSKTLSSGEVLRLDGLMCNWG